MNLNTPPRTIAIDGPAASGKTTVGEMLAERLGYVMLDTGSMYRAATFGVLIAGIDPSDENGVVKYAQSVQIDVVPPTGWTDGRHYTVLVNGIDVTWQIRAAAVDRHVSQVSQYAAVRQEMVERQRIFGERGEVVMVGRDIGTVVLPDAPLKVYMEASAEERARRRYAEITRRGIASNYQKILDEIIRRDAHDSGRAHSPLRPANDAHIIDTTAKTPEETLDLILEL